MTIFGVYYTYVGALARESGAKSPCKCRYCSDLSIRFIHLTGYNFSAHFFKTVYGKLFHAYYAPYNSIF